MALHPQAMTCPTCAVAFPYTHAACAAAFLSHANECEALPEGADAPAPHARPYAHLFRVRFHTDIAATGPPARGGGWPTPDGALATSTPSTRAIVVKHGPCYALRAGDAQLIATVRGGVRVLLGSEAAARAPEWLTATRVGAIVNCAHNSVSLDAAALSAAGVARGVRQVALVDAADVPGQDAGALIAAGAAALAAAVAAVGDDARASGGGVAPRAVLVHCVAGISRSASVVIAWLVTSEGATLAEAAATVRAARPVAMPNIGFWRALRDIEARTGRAASVPEAALLALHPQASYPVSTHIFGDAERS